MDELEELCSFHKLYRAHLSARRGKRNKAEVISFEMDLAYNLCRLQADLAAGRYMPQGYYSFITTDPKVREIHALHYPGRVVQHALCDNILAPHLEKRLIHDNAACRIGKGTHFAIYRLSEFLREHYRQYSAAGYFLKCDICKYFNSIDHSVLRQKLRKMLIDDNLQFLLDKIIDSYHYQPGKGLPMGNQTSQWFALCYLDGLDRLVKEHLRIKHYTRYMDDCVLIHPCKDYLKQCLGQMRQYAENQLRLEFNEKTQIFPLKNGVEYLGFHFYLTESGKVVRKLKTASKKRFKRRLQAVQQEYSDGLLELAQIRHILASYRGHLKHGHCQRMHKHILSNFVIGRGGH